MKSFMKQNQQKRIPPPTRSATYCNFLNGKRNHMNCVIVELTALDCSITPLQGQHLSCVSCRFHEAPQQPHECSQPRHVDHNHSVTDTLPVYTAATLPYHWYPPMYADSPLLHSATHRHVYQSHPHSASHNPLHNPGAAAEDNTCCPV